MVDGKERARFLKSTTTNGGWVSVLAKSGKPVLTLLDFNPSLTGKEALEARPSAQRGQ